MHLRKFATVLDPVAPPSRRLVTYIHPDVRVDTVIFIRTFEEDALLDEERVKKIEKSWS